MKRLVSIFIALIVATFALSAKPYRIGDIENVQLADRHRYTSNPDGILSPGAVEAIDSACDSLRAKGVAQIAVVAVKEIEGGDPFTFAHELFSSWGVGTKGADNGLGILLSLNPKEIRFVTGKGLEGVMPDALCKRIQQKYMVEHLSRGEYDKGMIEGIAAISTLLVHSELPAVEEELTDGELIVIFGAMSIAIIVMAMMMFFAYRSAYRCPKCGKYHLRHTESQIIEDTRSYQLVARTFVCPDCGHALMRQSRISKGSVVVVGGGGFGRGGFGGGGFGGGFGGGSFGGGGAGSRF